MPSPRFWLLIGFMAAAGIAAGAPTSADPGLRVRAGLPGVAVRAAGEMRVAYLGGSITAAADGWRSLTTAWLQARYPQARVVEIDAGLPGTGSDLGVCRLGQDVLRHHPDLVFVEFAVNDAATPPARIERTMEGIVRQIREADPRTDICFVYTVSTPGLADLTAGTFSPAAQAMERVAAHYAIPSVHFGLEVARRVAAGSLVFKGTPGAAAGPGMFSADGVHPTPAGHRIYFEVLSRALPRLLEKKAETERRLPPPLHPDNWSGAQLRLFDALAHSGEWGAVALDDANLRGATKHLLPAVWRTSSPGAAVEFTFTGRRFGLLGIAAPDSGQFRVIVDDLPVVSDTFFDAYASPTFCRQRGWFYPQELAPGVHRVRVELTDRPVNKAALKAAAGKTLEDLRPYQADRLTLCGALVVGEPRP